MALRSRASAADGPYSVVDVDLSSPVSRLTSNVLFEYPVKPRSATLDVLNERLLNPDEG